MPHEIFWSFARIRFDPIDRLAECDRRHRRSPMTYFSEREKGERPRDQEEISDNAWGGIRALVRARIVDGSFGARYSETCPDGGGPTGTDENGFWLAMRGENPSLQREMLQDWSEEMPRSLDILDMIEFCWQCIGKPIQISYHRFFSHYHLRYDVEAGRDDFRDNINRIFRRNGLAYALSEHGRIERLAPPLLRGGPGSRTVSNRRFRARWDAGESPPQISRSGRGDTTRVAGSSVGCLGTTEDARGRSEQEGAGPFSTRRHCRLTVLGVPWGA